MSGAMKYAAIPFVPRLEIVSPVLRETAKHESLFTDYQKTCPDQCFECEQCMARLRAVANTLAQPNALVWEVWPVPENGDDVSIAGIMYLTDLVYGCDASAHYVFFDSKLKDKTEIIRSVIGWLFTDHEGWQALRRLTIEIPDYAIALARHAQKSLGFGGDYEYSLRHGKLQVEGVKKASIRWRGEDRDTLIMGLHNGDVRTA